MALTDKKRRFAAALRGGATNKAAAIAAGYSEKTAAQAGSRLAKDADVLAELSRAQHVEAVKSDAAAKGVQVSLPDLGKLYSDPQDFLKAVMNDPRQDPKLRVDAAKTLMPYQHGKIAEQGKKDKEREAAGKVGGKFGAPPPPTHLRSVGGK